MEGLDVMKLLMERRKVELKEEEEAAEAKQNADREVKSGFGIRVVGWHSFTVALLATEFLVVTRCLMTNG